MLNTLNVAQSGLAVASEQVENIMNNVANENTEGYKKRVVSTSESSHNDARNTGRGVNIDSVDRVTNVYMYDNLIDQQSKDAEYTELSNMLADIESVFYETEDSGFSNDLDRYFQSLEDLRSNPYNDIYRTNLSNQGQIIVDDLQTLYKGVEDIESNTKSITEDNVDEINGILNDIGSVNKQISDSINPSNDLLDKRDQLESRLSEYVDIDVDRSDTYSLSIGGLTAIRYDTNIHAIDLVDDKAVQKDIYADTNNNSTLVGADWGGTDTITYSLDKDNSVTVTNGETVNGIVVDKDNVVQALTYKINNDPKLSNTIEAHNGQYSVDENGNKIEQDPQTDDHFLMIESKVAGTDGKFESRIVVNDDDTLNSNGEQVSNIVEKNLLKSVEANNDIHFEIFNEELEISTGKTKSMLDNIDTTSSDNKFTEYKDMLDNFAKSLSDISQSYIDLGDGNYVSGEEASLLDPNKENTQNIGLFSGASVDTLSFNESVVNELSQADLDYLSTIQWNDDINMDGTGENNTSFSKYLQKTKVTIAADKENTDYMRETQTAVTQSLQNNYDKYTKVNKDDEMLDLIKYQAAYDANAKLITVVDEMLQTILGMKR